MADDPNKKKHDGKLVSDQEHELRYLEQKTGFPRELIKKVQDQVGRSREKVEKKLEEMKKNGRK